MTAATDDPATVDDPHATGASYELTVAAVSALPVTRDGAGRTVIEQVTVEAVTLDESVAVVWAVPPGTLIPKIGDSILVDLVVRRREVGVAEIGEPQRGARRRKPA